MKIATWSSQLSLSPRQANSQVNDCDASNKWNNWEKFYHSQLTIFASLFLMSGITSCFIVISPFHPLKNKSSVAIKTEMKMYNLPSQLYLYCKINLSAKWKLAAIYSLLKAFHVEIFWLKFFASIFFIFIGWFFKLISWSDFSEISCLHFLDETI